MWSTVSRRTAPPVLGSFFLSAKRAAIEWYKHAPSLGTDLTVKPRLLSAAEESPLGERLRPRSPLAAGGPGAAVSLGAALRGPRWTSVVATTADLLPLAGCGGVGSAPSPLWRIGTVSVGFLVGLQGAMSMNREDPPGRSASMHHTSFVPSARRPLKRNCATLSRPWDLTKRRRTDTCCQPLSSNQRLQPSKVVLLGKPSATKAEAQDPATLRRPMDSELEKASPLHSVSCSAVRRARRRKSGPDSPSSGLSHSTEPGGGGAVLGSSGSTRASQPLTPLARSTRSAADALTRILTETADTLGKRLGTKISMRSSSCSLICRSHCRAPPMTVPRFFDMRCHSASER